MTAATALDWDAGWIETESGPAFVVVHPGTTPTQDTAVLICPPFGWQEALAYRSFRAWAQSLAAAGYPVARLTLPGAGDSAGGPDTPDLVDAWIAAVTSAATWLRSSTVCRRVVAVGVGLGGMIATQAVALGAEIDDLVLWAVPRTGSRLLRELKWYASIVAQREAIPRGGAGGNVDSDAAARLLVGEDGSLMLAGYALRAETANALKQLDLTAVELPAAAGRRVLLLERGSLGIEAQLKDRFEALGAEVTVAPGGGYDEMMSDPQHTEMPSEAQTETLRWLGLSSAPSARPPEFVLGAAEMTVDGATVRETATTFPLTGARGRGFAILTESTTRPRVPVTAVLVNAGAIHRSGPNRMWTEVARRWAAWGVPAIRVDLEAIGESDGDAAQHVDGSGLFQPQMIGQISAVLDELPRQGLPERAIVIGACSGAYTGFRVAVEDPRVIGGLFLNLFAIAWSPELMVDRREQAYLNSMSQAFRNRMANRDFGWKQMRTGVRVLRKSIGTKLSAGRIRRREVSEAKALLDRLREKQTEMLLLFSRDEPLLDQLSSSGLLALADRWPNLTVGPIPSIDHMFRALDLQAGIHRDLDRARDRIVQKLQTEPHLVSSDGRSGSV